MTTLYRLLSCFVISFLLMLASKQIFASTYKINANDYSSFWIWGRIKTAPYLHKAKELYILQGEIRFNEKTQKSILIPQGVSVLQTPQQKIWLVFRNYHLNWNNDELKDILNRIKSWENVGNNIQGIQIDFDAKTNNLKEYALFLQQLRQKLPSKYKLGITGLLDWTNVQDSQTLALLKDNIDELSIQTYQGSSTINNYQNYLKKISSMGLPYKVGIVQYGEWNPNLNFALDPNFKGYIVFLLREK